MSARIPLPLSAAWEPIWAKAAEKNGVAGEAHLFLKILDTEDEIIAMLLALSGVSREEARLYARSLLEAGLPSAEKKIGYARGVSHVLQLASREAKSDKRPFIEPHHFFIACVSHRRGSHLGEVLRPLGLDAARLRQHLRGIRAGERPYPRGNPLNDLTQGAKQAVEAAHLEMRASYCGRIATPHLLLGLLSNLEICEILERAGCNIEDLRKRARDSIYSDGEIASPQKRFSPGAKRALERAARHAKQAGRKTINCKDLLLGLLPQSETLGEKWRARGQKLDSLDFLWNAAQIEALRLSLGSAPEKSKTEDYGTANSGARFTPRQILRFGSIGGLLNGLILMFVGPLILLWLLVATSAVWLSRFPRQTKLAWCAFSGGWFCGWVTGTFVSMCVSELLFK